MDVDDLIDFEDEEMKPSDETRTAEEDAMMTDAPEVEDEVEMDGLDEDRAVNGVELPDVPMDSEKPDIDISSDIIQADLTEPEKVINTDDTVDVDIVSAENADWPPAPTEVPPVPSRLPDATLVPGSLNQGETKFVQSQANSVVAEPPVSPSKTMASLPTVAQPLEANVIEGIPVAVENGRQVELNLEKEQKREETAETAVLGDELVLESEPFVPPSDETIIDVNVIEPTRDSSENSHVMVDEIKETYPSSQEAAVEETEAVKPELDAKAEGIHEIQHENEESTIHSDEQLDKVEEAPALLPIVVDIFDGVYRPLFYPLSLEMQEGFEILSEGATEKQAGLERPLLPDMAEDLLRSPLRDLFVALRAALGDDWDESRGTEMILHEKALGLKIGEDNKHADTLTLYDLVDLYTRCNCLEPMTLTIEHDSVRFIAKYEAIKKVLDGMPENDSSSEEGEQDHDDDVDIGELQAHTSEVGHGGNEESDVHEEAEGEEEEYDEEHDYDEDEEAFYDYDEEDHFNNPLEAEFVVDGAGDGIEGEEAQSSETSSAAVKIINDIAAEQVDDQTATDQKVVAANAAVVEPVETSSTHLNGDERQDPEDDVEETAGEDEVDTFGIDAATRKAEQDVEAAESTVDAHADSLNGTNGTVPSPRTPGSQDATLKRSLEDTTEQEADRAVKRKISDTPDAPI